MEIGYAFRALSIDVISEYAFGECYDLLGKEDLGRGFFEMVMKRGKAIGWFEMWPGLLRVVGWLPRGLVGMLSEGIKWTFRMEDVSTLVPFILPDFQFKNTDAVLR